MVQSGTENVNIFNIFRRPDPLNSWAKRHGNLLTDKLQPWRNCAAPPADFNAHAYFSGVYQATVRRDAAEPAPLQEGAMRCHVCGHSTPSKNPYTWVSTSDIVGR